MSKFFQKNKLIKKKKNTIQHKFQKFVKYMYIQYSHLYFNSIFYLILILFYVINDIGE